MSCIENNGLQLKRVFNFKFILLRLSVASDFTLISECAGELTSQ